MAQVCKIIKVTVKNEPGQLAKVTEAIKAADINICAVAGWTEGDKGVMTFCSADADKACAAASPVVDNCEFTEVVCVEAENRPGALFELAQKIADAGINIKSLYGAPGEADKGTVVIESEDNAKVAELLG
jgi:hypothetical protein